MQKINLKPIFERVKYNALDYIGLYEAPVGDLATILSEIAQEHGSEIFLDAAALSQVMKDAGVDEAEIHRICLMTQVTGLRNVVLTDARTAQNDLDRYIQNAILETGFNRETVLRLTSSIAYAAGNTMNCEIRKGKQPEINGDAVVALAYNVYKDQLDAFGKKFQIAFDGDEETDIVLDFSVLEPMVNFGIPRAKYYLGCCLLYGIQLEQDEARGLELLQEAADGGDSQAAGVLGDYHFALGGSDHWTKAFDYYTGFGSLALNDHRRDAVVSILNHKHFNRKMLVWNILLFLGLLATVIWVPGVGLYGARLFWGWLAVIAQLALLVVTIMHYRTKPYDCVYRLPATMICVWFLYMLIRLWF